ncbi:MAG: LPS-assembly protein LptD, partial [Devosiaceae bacterium]
PFFAHADPTVDRKSGFLRPDYVADCELGFGVSVPYYFALDPSYDLTVTGTGYSQQGLHLEAEWRQRLESGHYSIRASGIRQFNSDEFLGQPGEQDFRGSLASNGAFSINEHWDFGWNLYWQSDRRYFRDYTIESGSADQVVSDIYITGLHDRSYFDARVERIEVTTLSALNQNQPWTLPVIDYDRRFTPGALGGELRVEANLTTTLREDSDIDAITINGAAASRFEGLEGQSTRISLDTGWRREFIGPLGQVFTPQVGFRGDVIGYNLDNNAATAGFINGEDVVYRAMPMAALEWRWPFLITAPGSTHVVEPIGQVIVRPNATEFGQVPIEDSQSLVFDASNLFENDKFSGFDQLEGGTRANVGVRYAGTFDNGLGLSALIGQSFHLAGDNPYAQTNLQVRNEADSGLETDQSDYVAMVGANWRNQLTLSASGRFDEDDFSVERGEVRASANMHGVSASAIYGFLAAQPNRGVPDEHHGVFGSLAFNITDSWRATGSARYDIDDSQLMGIGLGIAYQCDCYGIGLQFTHIPASANEGIADNRVMLNVSLRTIGGYQTQILGGGGFGEILPE